MVKAGIIGVNGYTGGELVRLLAGHPRVEIVAASSRSQAGRRLAEIFPSLRGVAAGDLPVVPRRTRLFPVVNCSSFALRMELQPGWLRSFCAGAGRSLTWGRISASVRRSFMNSGTK